MEDVFDALRDGKIDRSPELFDLLYTGVDNLERFYNEIDESREVQDDDVSELIDNLKKASEGEEFGDVDHGGTDPDAENRDIESIKVDADTLDNLLNSVGELMIIEKKLRKELDTTRNREIRQAVDQFKRLGEDIRDQLMTARMVPVSQVFERFPRTVRDISKDTGKKIDFEINGGGLRMDRTVLEEISDPVLHMLRNAIDHGIEPPEERERKGKDREGQLKLEASREGEEAVITVEDDGRGIDVEKIVDKAIENELITSNRANKLSGDEKIDLMFDPNLSTNNDVTELSGRGVGMSIVKQTAEQLQGTYNVETEENEGTKIELRLPITLAIVKCFIMEAGGKTFGVPINGIEHVKKVTRDELKTIEGKEVFVFEDQELPMVDLDERFSERGEYDPEADQEFEVVIIYIGKKKAGVKVSSINQIEEFVIKDVDFLQQENIAGSSILPDGTPIPILDTRNILR
jgi:two-component system chemotaxis sensor kinase CheA